MDNIQRLNKKKKIHSKINGTNRRPRLSVYKSNKHIYAQLIDDQAKITLLAVNSQSENEDKNLKPVDRAYKIGLLLAKKALMKNISNVVFDRSVYVYHGQIKALAEGARKGGLKF